MSGLATPRVRIPRSARPGEVIEIRTLIEHPMTTGLHQDGRRIGTPDLIERLSVRVNGEVALEAELRNGTSANPYHSFFLRLDRTSEIELVWTDQQGRIARHLARVSVG